MASDDDRVGYRRPPKHAQFNRHPPDDGLHLADSALLRRNRQARTVVIHRHGALTVAGPLTPVGSGSGMPISS